MKNIKFINIIIVVIISCIEPDCQTTHNRLFYNCNHTFRYKREFDTGNTILVDTINTTIRLVVIDFQLFKDREKFHNPAQTPII